MTPDIGHTGEHAVQTAATLAVGLLTWAWIAGYCVLRFVGWLRERARP